MQGTAIADRPEERGKDKRRKRKAAELQQAIIVTRQAFATAQGGGEGFRRSGSCYTAGALGAAAFILVAALQALAGLARAAALALMYVARWEPVPRSTAEEGADGALTDCRSDTQVPWRGIIDCFPASHALSSPVLGPIIHQPPWGRLINTLNCLRNAVGRPILRTA